MQVCMISSKDLRNASPDQRYSLAAIHQDPLTSARYKYVNYIGSAPASAGDAVYTVNPGAQTARGYRQSEATVTLSEGSGIDEGLGILVADVEPNQYVWVQIRGAATLNVAPGTGSNGDTLGPSGAADGSLAEVNAASTMRCAAAEDRAAGTVIARFPE